MRIDGCFTAVAVSATLLAGTASAETCKLAMTDVEGLERLQAEWGPFKLEAATGDTFEFSPVSNRTTAAAEALRAKRAAFVITGRPNTSSSTR